MPTRSKPQYRGPYPIANADATDVEGVNREFRASIDLCLNGCAELGIEPVAPAAIPTTSGASN